MRLVEILAAILLTIEMVVLFAGIIARYLFHHPFVWSDEVNSIAFLWRGMFGPIAFAFCIATLAYLSLGTYVPTSILVEHVAGAARRRAGPARGAEIRSGPGCP